MYLACFLFLFLFSEELDKIQKEYQQTLTKLSTLTQEKDEQIEENKRLSYDNKLFHEELVKVKEDIAKYKQLLEAKDEETYDGESGSTDMAIQQQLVVYEETIEEMKAQFKNFEQSVATERDRVQILDMQLQKEVNYFLQEIAKLILTAYYSALRSFQQ